LGPLSQAGIKSKTGRLKDSRQLVPPILSLRIISSNLFDRPGKTVFTTNHGRVNLLDVMAVRKALFHSDGPPVKIRGPLAQLAEQLTLNQ
jgi:hypothetical protein